MGYKCHICDLETKQLNGLMSRHYKKHCTDIYTKEQYKIDVLNNNGRPQGRCLICGKSTKIGRGESEYPKYCHPCYLISLKGEGNPNHRGAFKKYKCAFCGKEIEKFDSLTKNNQNAFCSNFCSSKFNSDYKTASDKRKTNWDLMSNGMSVRMFCKDKGISSGYANIIYKKYGPEFTENWINAYSKQHSSLEKFVKEKANIEIFDRGVDAPNFKYRPDFKLTDKTYLDVDGLYWHSEEHKDSVYHLDKRIAYEKAGFRLIQIREDEVRNKLATVLSMISVTIGRDITKIYARKTKIKETPSKLAISFFEANHLMGPLKSSRSVGLYLNDTLVMCVSYKKIKTGIDISRLASLKNTIVVGGVSKLIKHVIEKEHPVFVQSFVDLRYATGKSLELLGFKREKTSLGWKWTDYINTYNRLSCRANMDERHLSEKEHAEELGLYKIYDAGQAKYVKYL